MCTKTLDICFAIQSSSGQKRPHTQTDIHCIFSHLFCHAKYLFWIMQNQRKMKRYWSDGNRGRETVRPNAHTIIGAVKWTNVPCVRMYCGIKTSELGRGFEHFNLFFFSLFSFCCGWLNDDNKNAASFDIPRLFFSDKKKQKKNGNITPTTHAVNKRDRERIWRANMCIRECFVWSRWLIYTHRNDEYSASECLPPHSMGWKKLSHMPSWCEHTKQKKKQPNPPTLWQLAMNKWEMQRRKEKIYPTTATQMLHISTGKIQLLCIMHTIKWVFSFVGHLVVWCCFFPSSSSRFAVRVVCMFCLVDFLLYIFFLLCTLHREFKWCVYMWERRIRLYAQ